MKNRSETGINNIKELAQQIAADAKVKLSSIQLEDGRPLGCKDANILSMTSKGITVYVKIYHDEIEGCHHKIGPGAKPVMEKLINGVERLQVMLKG